MSGRSSAGFTALSRFEVIPGWEVAVAEAFRDRPRLVDHEPGFVRLDVLRPTDRPTEFWLLTFWTDEASFRDWHRGHGRKTAHRGIPAGLRLVPGSAEIIGFDHLSS